MPIPDRLQAIVDYGTQTGALAQDAPVADRHAYIDYYAQSEAKSPDEYKRFMAMAQPTLDAWRVNELDPTGQLAAKRQASLEQKAAHPILGAASDVFEAAAGGLTEAGAGVAGLVSPSLRKSMLETAERDRLAAGADTGSFAYQAGGFVPFVVGGAAGKAANAATLFGSGANTAQEQGATGAGAAFLGGVNAVTGLVTSKFVGNQLSSRVMDPLTRTVAQRVGASEVGSAVLKRAGQAVAGDIGAGVGFPTGQAAADTLQIGPDAGARDLAEIPAALAANLALSPLAHGLTLRAGAMKDVAASRAAAAFQAKQAEQRATELAAQQASEARYGMPENIPHDPALAAFAAREGMPENIPHDPALAAAVARGGMPAFDETSPEVGALRAAQARAAQGPRFEGLEPGAPVSFSALAQAAKATPQIDQIKPPKVVDSRLPPPSQVAPDLRAHIDSVLPTLPKFDESGPDQLKLDVAHANQLEKTLPPEFQDTLIRETLARLQRTPIIEAKNVPFSMGMSQDGKKIYRDPAYKNDWTPSSGREMPLYRLTGAHEISEQIMMEHGATYSQGHAVATLVERRLMERMGLSDKEISEYEESQNPSVKKAESWTGEPPADLYTRPYIEEGRTDLLVPPDQRKGASDAQGLRSDQEQAGGAGQAPGRSENLGSQDRPSQPGEVRQAPDQVEQAQVAPKRGAPTKAETARRTADAGKAVDIEGTPYAVIPDEKGGATLGVWGTGKGPAWRPVKTATERPANAELRYHVEGGAPSARPGDATAFASPHEAMAKAASAIGIPKRQGKPVETAGKEAVAQAADLARTAKSRAEVVQGKIDEARTTSHLHDILQDTRESDLRAYLQHADPENLRGKNAEWDGVTLEGHIRDELSRRSGGSPGLTGDQAVAQGLRKVRRGADTEEHAPAALSAATFKLFGKDSQVQAAGEGRFHVTTSAGHQIDVVFDKGDSVGRMGGMVDYGTDGEGRINATITIGSDGSVGLVAHEAGHPILDHLLTPTERRLLLDRVSDQQAEALVAHYAERGHEITHEQAREEAALDRLRDYENHGVLERSIWQHITDFIREAAHAFGIGPGSERTIMDYMRSGAFFSRPVQAEAGPTTRRGNTERGALPDVARAAKEGAKDVAAPVLASAKRMLGSPKAAGASVRDRLVQGVRRLSVNPIFERMLNSDNQHDVEVGKRMVDVQARIGMNMADAAPIHRQQEHLNTTVFSDAAQVRAVNDALKLPTPKGDGPLSSPLYDAVQRKDFSGTGHYGDIMTNLKAAVDWSGNLAKTVGLKATGTAPRVPGADLSRVLNGVRPGLKDFFIDTLLAHPANKGISRAEAVEHFAVGGSSADAAVRLSPMELARKFAWMPEALHHEGTTYRLFNADPATWVQHMLSSTAHRVESIREFGKGYDPTTLLPGYQDMSPAGRQSFQDWIAVTHGRALGPRLGTETAPVWVGRAMEGANEFTSQLKTYQLISATAGDVIGSLNPGTAGVRNTVRAVLAAAKEAPSGFAATKNAGFVLDAPHLFDPNKPLTSIVAGVRQSVARVKALSDAFSAAVAQHKAEYMLDDLKSGGKIGQDSILKALGYGDSEIRKFKDGSADPGMQREFVRRVVQTETGASTVAGTRSAFSNYWLMQRLGPAFMSWSNAQASRLAKLAANAIEKPGADSIYALGLGAAGMMVAPGAGAYLFNTWWKSGEEGVQQELDKPTMDQLADFGKAAFFGGAISAGHDLVDAIRRNDLKEGASALAYPASVAFDLRDAVQKTLEGWHNGEFIGGLYDGTTALVPIAQRMRDAYAWSVEDANPGALRSALSSFHAWRTDNPDLGGKVFEGVGGQAEGTETSRAIDRIIRGIKYAGDGLDNDKLRALVAAEFAEGKDPSQVAQSIRSRRMLAKLPEATREVAIAKFRQEYGELATQRLLRYDALLDSLASMVD